MAAEATVYDGLRRGDVVPEVSLRFRSVMLGTSPSMTFVITR